MAHADPPAPRDLGMDDAAPVARPNAVYLEALGKGGLWGVGYERALSKRFGVGAVVSYAVLDGSQQMYAAVPYLTLRLLGEGHHRWFADAGPELVYLRTPSPVMEWSGASSTGIGGQLSSGYEYRDHFLFRIYGEVVGGAQHNHHVEPWLGMSVGWTF